MKKLLFTPFLLFTVSTYASTILSKAPLKSSLIIYNSSVALVSETKKLSLKKGEKEIIYNDVASTIDTDSVNITLPSSITLYLQQYRFDKLTLKKLLDAHIGKSIVYVKENQKKKQIVTLLAHSVSNAIVKDSNKMIMSIETKNIRFNNIPKSLLRKPSLVWKIDAHQNINSTLDITYLIKNISWKSDYIINLNDLKANITGWITIDNRSGKNYQNTKLQLLAGDINRISQPKPQRVYAKNMMFSEALPSKVIHQPYEGYHFYTIPFKVSLANNEKTQIKFITLNSVAFVKKYKTNMSNPLYFRSHAKHNVTQYIELEPLKKVLPKGVVRIYSKPNDETKVLLGESLLKHTPKGEKIVLTLGTNFDLKVDEVVKSRNDTKNFFDVTIIYKIKNFSDKIKNIQLLVPFNKNTTSSINTSQPYKFKYGNKVLFNIQVEGMQTKKFEVNYRSKK